MDDRTHRPIDYASPSPQRCVLPWVMVGLAGAAVVVALLVVFGSTASSTNITYIGTVTVMPATLIRAESVAPRPTTQEDSAPATAESTEQR